MRTYIVSRVHQYDREEILYFIDSTEESLLNFLSNEIVKMENYDQPYDVFKPEDVQISNQGNTITLSLGNIEYKAIQKFILI